MEFAEITKNISGFRVGISWFTGKSRKRNAKALVDQNRYSLSVSDLEILASVKPVQWFNLQYGDYVREVARVEDFTDCFHSFSDYSANGDFLEYGAQILNVDLVVSMDSTAAVFAACMGKEVWVLCPNDPFWFWMVNEQKNYCSNVSLFIKPWNLPWADFLTLEVVPRLQQRVSNLLTVEHRMSDLLEKAKALNRSQKFEEAIELLKPELSGDHSEETLAVFCSSLASVSKYEEGVAL